MWVTLIGAIFKTLFLTLNDKAQKIQKNLELQREKRDIGPKMIMTKDFSFKEQLNVLIDLKQDINCRFRSLQKSFFHKKGVILMNKSSNLKQEKTISSHK